MDFKCFFIEYKIGLKDIKDRIPLKELLKLKYKKTIFKIFFLEFLISILIFASIIPKFAEWIYSFRYINIIIQIIILFYFLKKYGYVSFKNKYGKFVFIEILMCLILSIEGYLTLKKIFTYEMIIKLVIDKYQWLYIILLFQFILLLYFENKKMSQKVRLDLFYKKYSFKRKMFLISLLKKYKVQINNIDTLTFFINEAKRAKKEIELFLFFIKLGKYFSPIIISLIIYFIQKLIEEKLYELAILLLLILLFFFLVVYSIWSVFYPIIFSKYDYLIYDLNQIIIFNKHYSNIDKNS